MTIARSSAQSLYRRILGERFDSLPEVLRRFHETPGGGRAHGKLQVERAGGWLSNALASWLGLPEAGNNISTVVEVKVEGDCERWVRQFDSSTPAITSALINELTAEFSRIGEIHSALSPGNQNPRGASTVGAVLSYLGREIRVWQNGRWVNRPGWGDSQRLDFPPPVGRRRVYNCDVPDLELFPSAFNAQTVRFSAGLELNVLNHLLSLCALPCRWFGLNLMRRARLFLNLSLMLFPFGTTNGALAVWLRGRDHAGGFIERRIALVTDYDGPATPSSAAIVLTRKILAAAPLRRGAFPCVGFLTLDELMVQLRPLGIWCVRGDESGWHKLLRNHA